MGSPSRVYYSSLLLYKIMYPPCIIHISRVSSFVHHQHGIRACQVRQHHSLVRRWHYHGSSDVVFGGGTLADGGRTPMNGDTLVRGGASVRFLINNGSFFQMAISLSFLVHFGCS